MAVEPRLRADIWVAAYRARLEAQVIPVFIRARGDATAGAVLIKLNTLDGQAVLYQRGMAFDGPRGWDVLAQGADSDVEAALSRQREFDPDLWVLEVEDASGRTLLDEDGLRD